LRISQHARGSPHPPPVARARARAYVCVPRIMRNASLFSSLFPPPPSVPPDGERLTIALCTVRVKPRVLSWWAYPRALLDVCTLTIAPTRKRGSATLVARDVTEESRKQETRVKPILHRYVRQTRGTERRSAERGEKHRRARGTPDGRTAKRRREGMPRWG